MQPDTRPPTRPRAPHSRPRSRPELESELEQLFRRLVRTRLGGRLYKLAPTDVGMPDRLVLLPGGRVYLVELKTETGTVSPKQRLWHSQAAALGTKVTVLWGRAGIEAWVAVQDEPPAPTTTP